MTEEQRRARELARARERERRAAEQALRQAIADRAFADQAFRKKRRRPYRGGWVL